jgi:hypothetical protein
MLADAGIDVVRAAVPPRDSFFSCGWRNANLTIRLQTLALLQEGYGAWQRSLRSARL